MQTDYFPLTRTFSYVAVAAKQKKIRIQIDGGISHAGGAIEMDAEDAKEVISHLEVALREIKDWEDEFPGKENYGLTDRDKVWGFIGR